VKIRVLMTLAGSGTSLFSAGQVIEVTKPTAEMLAWLRPLADGSVRAEIVREDESDEATISTGEHAVAREGRRRGRAVGV